MSIESKEGIRQERTGQIRRLFPEGVPRLWCALLTHFRGNGEIDSARIKAHLDYIRPHVGGLLVPGTTGDGWALTPEEREQLLRLVLEPEVRGDLRILAGILEPTAEACRGAILDLTEKFDLFGDDQAGVFAERGLAGFTVCAPHGGFRDQFDIEEALDTVLEMNFPTALYQLPQVTENEIEPETFDSLASRHPNLIFFKDSGGGDHIALADRGRNAVFLVRGAEGDYASWLMEKGGPYDGLLLSTANAFAAPLHDLLEDLEMGDHEAAGAASNKLTAASRELFEAVAAVPSGNAFTNAAKAADHFMAYGPEGLAVPPPMLHGGSRLPTEVLEHTKEILLRHGLMPEIGYIS